MGGHYYEPSAPRRIINGCQDNTMCNGAVLRKQTSEFVSKIAVESNFNRYNRMIGLTW